MNTDIRSREQGAGSTAQSAVNTKLGAVSAEQGARSKEQGAGSREGQTFENLEIWQEAVELAVRVYALFRECRDFSFRDQVCRASVSVSSNIAEGYERDSNVEFIRYLFIAKASCGELRSQACVAQRLKLIEDQPAAALIEQARRLSRRIQKLIEVRREKFN
jgi:four helix bundle protein